METKGRDSVISVLTSLYKPHPWHGISIGEKAPDIVTVYVEMVPTDTVKYEIDKITGYLKVDRPQRYSNVCPSLYGLLPQTYCGNSVAELCAQTTGRLSIKGDGDPLDICVLTEKTIKNGGIILEAIPIGGLRMIDGDEVDDKIIAVMKGDAVYSSIKDINQVPKQVIDRLKHYFLTYKQSPDNEIKNCDIVDIYDKETAFEVIRRSREDYNEKFSFINEVFEKFVR